MKSTMSMLAVALLYLSTSYAIVEAADPETSIPAATEIRARFSLVDHQGRAVTQETYRGNWLLVFFGYTSCPDICPMTLYDITLALKALDDDADRIQPIFISVDPERDTVDVLAKYIPSFGPSIVGLTGEPEQVKQTAQSFRVYYEKVAMPGNPGAYTIDHQSYLYLIRPDGEFETVFPHGMSVDRMTKALRLYIGDVE
jgi:protein SCO1/2